YMLRLSAISCIILSLFTTAHTENYHWPMDAPPALTSTFGEYRGGRLHAAIDLKTWGKEGYPVTAIADGYV
ncbi:MAG: M23 family peptidase, partial [Gemmatimonadetes bacterium]|nr:M23 family peptidase [Gemmatimonadota bacterium]